MLNDNFSKANIFSLTNVNAKKVLDSLEDENDGHESRKRKRLDDFTPQERMIRRKLKNRVAAQTARDRKKERMEQLEDIVSRIEKENKELKRSNEELRTNMHYLMNQNTELRTKFGMDDTAPESGDHTYTAKKLKLESSCQTQVSTPVVPDHDLIVIKKEEESETEHAAETTDTSCFLNHDVVSQSQIDQLLDFLEQTEPKQILESNASSKIRIQTEAEVTENIQIGGSITEDRPVTNTASLSDEETDELFQIYEDIRELVGEPDNSLDISDKMELNPITEELLNNIPDDVIRTVSSTSPSHIDSFNMSADMLLDDDTSSNISDSSSEEVKDILNFMDETSTFGKIDDNWDDVFSELFPALAPV